MKKLLLLPVLFLLIFAGISFAQDDDINTPYNPTKREWLSVQLAQEYNKVALRQKVHCDIDFTILDNYVDVYVNYPGKQPSKIIKQVKEDVTEATKKVIEKYSWSRDFLVRIKTNKE